MKSDFFIYYSFVCSVFARLIQTSPGGSLKYNSNPESESDLYIEICVSARMLWPLISDFKVSFECLALRHTQHHS